MELFKAHFTVPVQGLRLIYVVQGAQLAHIAIRLCSADGKDLDMISAIDPYSSKWRVAFLLQPHMCMPLHVLSNIAQICSQTIFFVFR